VQQAGSNFGSAVFDYGKSVTEVKSAMAAFTALLLEPNDDTTLAAKPAQPTQQLILGHPAYR
jgi:hypothetical protein